MATGCGVIAIEAAARGHRVVATDLYESALALARWNAALNGIADIDFRQGHLFEPVRGERFALILTAPHYGRVYDQLRVETLLSGVPHIEDGGRLVLATQLEWEGSGPPHLCPAVLVPLCRREGLGAQLSPIDSPLKRQWFQRSTSLGGLPEVPSRARFLVELWRPGDGTVAVQMPAALPARDLIPLSRLTLARGPGAYAAVASAQDAQQLSELVAQLQAGSLTLSGPLPAALYDSCRFGDGTCLDRPGSRGAAAAILDVHGGVRPCAFGQAVAPADRTLADYQSALAARANEAAARRGCATCAAEPSCSRCLFPTPLDEAAYCDFIRAHTLGLARLRQLTRLLAALAARKEFGTTLRVKAGPSPHLLFARQRPSGAASSPYPSVAARWRSAHAWVVAVDDRHYLACPRESTLALTELDPFAAEIAELVGEHASQAELVAYTARIPLPPRMLSRALERLASGL
jgi:hypothetical protein